jgi:spermidine/putrescine transport system permease protein
MRKYQGSAYTMPTTLWLTVFFIIPLSIILVYSFLEPRLYGGVSLHFSLGSYAGLFRPSFLTLTFATFWMAAVASALSVGIALPCAYFIARSSHKNVFLFLVIIPFWTDFLIRIYSWIVILGNNGVINSFLLRSHLVDYPLQLLYNKWAVITVMVYTYLPFSILPLYATIEKFDFSLLEAARDLGASKPQSIFKVLLPNIKAGIVTAVLFSFIPAFGNFAIPALVGGQDSFMLGSKIARELTVTHNWPLSSAISMVLTLVTTIGVVIFVRLNQSAAARAKALQAREESGI